MLGAYALWEGRRKLDAYLDAAEALVDLYRCDLACAIGVTSDGARLSLAEGVLVNRIVSKGG